MADDAAPRESWTPHPDPTVLTTEALHREIGGVRASLDSARRAGYELLEVRLAAMHELIDARLNAMHELFDSRMDARLIITAEKFNRIDQKLDLVESQRIEQKKDTKDAVDAALTAQKEAVREQTTASDAAIAKAERAITKEMEQLRTTFNVTFEGIRRDIDINRERVSAIERRIIAIEQVKAGGREAVTDRRASNAAIYALAGFVLTILTIVGILVAMKM